MKQHNQSLDVFIRAVRVSRVLTGIQKRELLDKPELLPQSYRDRIIEILLRYDRKAEKRIDYVRRLTQQGGNDTLESNDPA